jgi:hypothetical protein
MPLSLNFEGAQKAQLVISLAALLLNDCKAEITVDNLQAGSLIFSFSTVIYFWFSYQRISK